RQLGDRADGVPVARPPGRKERLPGDLVLVHLGVQFVEVPEEALDPGSCQDAAYGGGPALEPADLRDLGLRAASSKPGAGQSQDGGQNLTPVREYVGE